MSCALEMIDSERRESEAKRNGQDYRLFLHDGQNDCFMIFLV